MAMGLKASPVTPPTLKLKTGFCASILIAIPGPIELTAVIASAPASSAAFATVQISGILGDILTNRGNLVTFLTADVISKVACGVPCPASMPNPGVCGQERGISIAENFDLESLLITCTKSSFCVPITRAITGAQTSSMLANSIAAASTPGFEYPTALSIPPSKVITVGFLCPSRGSVLTDFIVTAPTPFSTTRFNNAFVVPSMPDARIVGLASFMLHKFIDKSIFGICNNYSNHIAYKCNNNFITDLLEFTIDNFKNKYKYTVQSHYIKRHYSHNYENSWNRSRYSGSRLRLDRKNWVKNKSPRGR